MAGPHRNPPPLHPTDPAPTRLVAKGLHTMSDPRYPPFPEGDYTFWADDDDVIGLTVAKTYPSGWAIVRTNPPLMDGFDEYHIGDFLARCLAHHAEICKTFGWDPA